jgi:prevent-host-death family protein
MNIPVFDAKNRLSALLDAVEAGAEVTITRRGVPVAKLVPVAPGFDRAAARRAAEGLRAAARGQRLGGVAIAELIREGRA